MIINNKKKVEKIFITGVMRSGTTLLTRVLGAHPDIETFYQPLTVLLRKWREIYYKNNLGKQQNILPSGIDYWSNKERDMFFKVAGEVQFSKSVIDEVYTETKDRYETFDKSEKSLLHIDVLRVMTPGAVEKIINKIYLNMRKAYKYNKIIGIKEVWAEEFIPLLSNKAHCIHIIRDPRAVLASRNYGRIFSESGGKYPIVFVAKTWKRSIRYMSLFLNSSDNNEKYISLLYEDLINEPESVVRVIVEFLGIDFSSAMIDPSKFTTDNGKKWIPNSTVTSKIGFNTEPLSYWKRTLTPEEILIVEIICKKEMDMMGYKTTSSLSIESLRNYKEDDDIIGWLRNTDFIFDYDKLNRDQ